MRADTASPTGSSRREFRTTSCVTIGRATSAPCAMRPNALSSWPMERIIGPRTSSLPTGRIVAALVALLALASLWDFIRKTNFLVSRFIESVRFEDYAQRFSDPSGAGFDVLGDTLDAALKGLQARNLEATAEARYLSAIVDDSPSALLAVGDDGRIELLNKAARQLLGRQPIARVDDLELFGAEIAAAARLPPGARKISRLVIDGV